MTGITSDREMVVPTLADYPVRTFDKLRYADTDRQGHINNAVFATLFETGRVEILYDPAHPLASPGASFVIVKLGLEFRAELTWPGRVDIGTRVAAVGRSSVTLEQALFQSDRLVAVAESVIVQMNASTHKSEPLSEESVDRLRRAASSSLLESTKKR